MKAAVVEHTVCGIDTVSWSCAWSSRFELAFPSPKCYFVPGTQGRMCDLPVGLDIWDKVVSIPFSSSRVEWSRSVWFGPSSVTVRLISSAQIPLIALLINRWQISVGGFIDPSQDRISSHLAYYLITEGANHARRRTPLFISRISWAQRTYSRDENE